jgi:hypothetical protein
MTNKYYYFVSYNHSKGYGNGEYILEQKIEGIDILNELARYIEGQNGFSKKVVVILNFILLRVEEI